MTDRRTWEVSVSHEAGFRSGNRPTKERIPVGRNETALQPYSHSQPLRAHSDIVLKINIFHFEKGGSPRKRARDDGKCGVGLGLVFSRLSRVCLRCGGSKPPPYGQDLWSRRVLGLPTRAFSAGVLRKRPAQSWQGKPNAKNRLGMPSPFAETERLLQGDCSEILPE